MKYFKDKTGQIYALADADAAQATGLLPADCAAIDLDKVHLALDQKSQQDRLITPEFKQKRLADLRATREVLLNRITGVMVNLPIDQASLIAACKQARQQLLDTPAHVYLNSAKTDAQMNLAIKQLQASLQRQLPSPLQSIFAGLQL